MIDPEIAERFQGHLGGTLDGDEQLIWAGRPRVWLTLSWADVYGRLPFSLIFLAPLWLPLAIAADGRPPPTPPGPPLVLLGLFVAVRYVAEVYVRRSTVYGLTPSRAVTLRPIGPERFRWADPYQVKAFSHGVFGGGTIQFEADPAAMGVNAAAFLFAFRSAALSNGVWFDGVRDAKEVMTMLGAPP